MAIHGATVECNVAVVGAGLAGLAAARHLSPTMDVIVLEAAHSIGGRIKHIKGLVPWPVEIGPEFLHGKQNSSIMSIADSIGCKLRELPYPDCYYLGSESRLFLRNEADDHPDIKHVHEIFAGLAEEDLPVPDITMLQYLQQRGANNTVIQLAQSIYANDFGCSLDQLGMSECIMEAQEWIYGDTYIILDRPMSCIVDHLAQCLKIYTDSCVEIVDYSQKNGVLLRCSNGLFVKADCVILTVPVKILQENIISFLPPLPAEKEGAICCIGMSNAVKVFLVFCCRFWPEEMFDVVCTDCFLPEIWTTSYLLDDVSQDQQASFGKHLLVGFVSGKAAAAISALPIQDVLARSLLQLDKMFRRCGIQENHSSENLFGSVPNVLDPSVKFFTMKDMCGSALFNFKEAVTFEHPASSHFVGGTVVSWADDKFIRGGYSHPSLNAEGARSKLAKHVEQKLFFAGEATHPGVNPCMQAALDTGLRAAKEVAELHRINISKLSQSKI